MNILLVEDNPLDRLFITRALHLMKEFPHEIYSCSSLQEAIEFECNQPFDVILLDLCLPDSEGVQTFVRVSKAFPNIPVVVTTGTNDSALALEAMRLGAQDYLVKGSLTGSSMVRVLSFAVERHHYNRQLADQDRHYREILRHVPAIIWTTDSELRITSVAGTPLSLLNLTSEQLIGKILQDAIPKDAHSERALAAHHQALGGTHDMYESELFNRSFEVQVVPLKTNHHTQGVLGVAIDITERRERDRELAFARKMQESLWPTQQPEIPGFNIYGASYPALQTCGDWFDYLHWRDGAIGLVTGDVSGKGYGPAIMSAALASYLEAAVETQAEPQEIVSLCNRLFCKHSHDSGFAILSLARLRPHGKTLEYVGAGEEILILSGHGELKHTLPSSGLPLGLEADAHYDDPLCVPLDPGDIILLLTDGFREAHAEGCELFGTQRIVQVVAEHRDKSAQDIFHALRAACKSHCHPAPLHDDMTGIIAKVWW